MSTIMWKIARTTFARVDTVLNELMTKLRQRFAEVDTDLDGKSDSDHTHDDRYYTEPEMDTSLAGKSGTSHTHDDRYYREDEMDTSLAGKQASDDYLTDISGTTPGLGAVLWFDGANWVAIASPDGGGDKTLSWNDTTDVVEWS